MRWSRIWRDAWTTTVASLVGSVLLPYVSTWIPGISKHMKAPISFTVPLWGLTAATLLVVTLLASTVHRLFGRRKAKQVQVCTYCKRVIRPGEECMVVPHVGPAEVALAATPTPIKPASD